MRIVNQFPPNIDVIEAVFGKTRKGALFCYGDIIYYPGGGQRISAELHVHEAVHTKQQGKDIEGWWEKYLASPEFRLAEEIPAHQAEYKYIAGSSLGKGVKLSYLRAIARRLSGDFYGNIIGYREAKKLVGEGIRL